MGFGLFFGFFVCFFDFFGVFRTFDFQCHNVVRIKLYTAPDWMLHCRNYSLKVRDLTLKVLLSFFAFEFDLFLLICSFAFEFSSFLLGSNQAVLLGPFFLIRCLLGIGGELWSQQRINLTMGVDHYPIFFW